MKNAANLHAREELLNYKLLFDIKLAAARHDYHLLTYFCDVDHDGFDIIFDDHYTVRKVQLKTVETNATTQSWPIHRSILRPIRENWERLGFFHKGMAYLTDCGVEGGVILMEFDANKPECPVSYFYTDIYIITAIALGKLNRIGTTVSTANGLRDDLPNGKLAEKIGVAKGLFVPAATASNLLALLSLQCPERINWQTRVLIAGQEEKNWVPKTELLPSVAAKHIADIPNAIKQACGTDP
jgi:hypothetical protein